MRKGLGRIIIALLTLVFVDPRAAEASSKVKIAATVAPVHALVAMVTDGIVEPALLLRPGASPHDYALKPSEAQALDQADLVFWVGEGLEPWMAKAVTTLASDAVAIELGKTDGLTRLSFREAGVFEAHGHADHGGLLDPHLWLDPDNAAIWLGVIADALAKIDQANADAYSANADKAKDRLSTMTAEIEALLRPVTKEPYVVFHDAYQYFERRFGLHPLGAVRLGEADRPGPARIVEIKNAISESGAVCIFAEPQFEPKLIATVIEGSDVKSGMLDPIGAGLQPGAGLYPALMLGLAENLRDCLG